MKRVIYIGLVSIGFFVKPASENLNQIPTWKTTSTNFSEANSSTNGEGEITDPNNDKDENTRRKH